MFCPGRMTTPLWLSRSLRPFLYSSYVYFCHFLISSVSVRSLPFLSCTMPILAWNVPLVSLVFLRRSLLFHLLLFSSISLHCSLKKAFLSLLTVLWNTAFRWVYLSLSYLPFTYFQLFLKPPQTTTLPSCISFFFGMIVVTASCAVLWTSIHSSSGTLSARSNPLNLFITSTG